MKSGTFICISHSTIYSSGFTVVNSVPSDGDAFGYLHENDIIHSINGQMVTSTKQCVEAINTSTPRVDFVITRWLTTNATNNATISGQPSQMLDSQVDKLQQMNIHSKPTNSLSSIQDTPTQIFHPTKTAQVTDTQNIIEHESETQLDLTLEASQELFPVQKSPISTVQVSFESRVLIGRERHRVNISVKTLLS